MKEQLVVLKESLQKKSEHQLALSNNHEEECKFAANHYLEELNVTKADYEEKKRELVQLHSE